LLDDDVLDLLFDRFFRHKICSVVLVARGLNPADAGQPGHSIASK
jgi:hypothetical protein